MKGLRKNERCPIHGRFDCCGREGREMPRRNPIKGPVTRIPDEHHPRGYREIRSPAEMRKLTHRKVKEQKGKCAGPCGKDFQDIREAVPDHIEPKGMGGQWRDDHPSNIRATCVECNNEKGSKRIFNKEEV